MRILWQWAVLACILVASCSKPEPGLDNDTVDLNKVREFDARLRLNDLQSIGSHNSYKQAIPPAELAMIALTAQDEARSLDYAHLPIAAQLDRGMRQLELDVYHDPDGGLFADPLLPRATAGQTGARVYDPALMDEPGLKVLHAHDVDVWSHCPTFVVCLEAVRDWSLANPTHTPIMVMVEAKDQPLKIPGAVTPLAFDEAAFASLDAEIMSVFEPDHLIVPDLVRGDYGTLRDGVLNGGWPTLDVARGKVFFTLDAGSSRDGTYSRGRASLEGLVLFTSTDDFDAPHAAYRTMNNPKRDGEAIRQAVSRGFVIRTRADAGTVEARTGDTTRLEAALASGAQFISTDYYEPRTEWSDYRARLPGDVTTRCNPVTASLICAGE